MTNVALESTNTSLFSKVSLLLSMSMIISAFGTWLGAGITSTGAMIALAVLFVLGSIAVVFAAALSTALGITALAIWTFVSGLFLGPVIQHYVVELGWQTVFLSYLGTGGIMAVCGAIGVFSGFNFTSIGRWLMFALLGLIAVSIIAIFVPFSHTVNIVWSLIGMTVFALYFMVDFYQAAEAENSWTSAILVTITLYLDFINFLLYLLKFLLEVLKKSEE